MSDPEVLVAAPWVRGVLEPCLLALLADGEAYGYQLAAQLEARGFGRVAGGTLYPALLRLESRGAVTCEWRAGDGGPGRKYYQLTDDGENELQDAEAQWSRFASVVSRLLRDGARR
jgi:PadR family transcriptional regulator, regulatory protein PadR